MSVGQNCNYKNFAFGAEQTQKLSVHVHVCRSGRSCCWPFMINSQTYFMSTPSPSHYLHRSFNGKNPQFCAAASSPAQWEKQSTRSPWSVFAGHLYGDISAICFHSTDLTNICFGFKANVNCRHLRGSRFWLWVWISLENGKNLKELNIYRFHPAFAALLVFCHLKTTHISWLNEIVGSNTL